MKARILTGVILLCFVVYMLWFASNYFFLSVNTLIILLTVWEWMNIIQVKGVLKRTSYFLIFLIILVLLYFQIIPYIFWLSLNTLVACYAIFALYKYDTQLKLYGMQHKWIKCAIGLLLLSSTWLSLNLMRFPPFSPNWLFFAFVIIWSADTGAFFAGRRWGKRKLAAQISPNKTLEGLFGGIILALLLSVTVLYLFPMPLKTILLSRLFGLIILVALFSAVGDLFESVMKRQAKIKDSGRLLPGHGGMLDRLDSLLFALPFYALISLYLI
jgi:phosphatidate cytidylyltransferase